MLNGLAMRKAGSFREAQGSACMQTDIKSTAALKRGVAVLGAHRNEGLILWEGALCKKLAARLVKQPHPAVVPRGDHRS